MAARHDDGGAGVLGAFLWGAITGAALAMLFAPAAGREIRERLRSQTRDFAANRNEYLASLERQLDEWLGAIDGLAARARSAGTDVRFEYERQVADMRAQSERARRLLDELRTAGGSAWNELAAGAERAWQELRRAVEQAASQTERPQ